MEREGGAQGSLSFPRSHQVLTLLVLLLPWLCPEPSLLRHSLGGIKAAVMVRVKEAL